MVWAALLLAASCGKPARYGACSVGMSLAEFTSVFPTAEKEDVDPADLDEVGPAPMLYVLERDLRRERYYFGEGKLVAVVAVTSADDRDALIAELTTANGKPSVISIMGTTVSQWSPRASTIKVIQATGATKVKIPGGAAQLVQPGEVLMVLGKD